MKKARRLLVIVLTIIVCQGILSSCKLPEPIIPEYDMEEPKGIVEEYDDTNYKTNVYNISILKSKDLGVDAVLELAAIGANLTYGDFLAYEKSIEEDTNIPSNARCYSYIGRWGNIYQIIITWEEGVEPGYDTPLTSAVLSLKIDPSVSADMMTENVAKVLNHKVTPGGK